MANGGWEHMEKLVLSKMTEHTKAITEVKRELSTLRTQVAVLTDREDREMLAAKSVAMKWATAIGAVVSAIISGVIGWGRGQ